MKDINKRFAFIKNIVGWEGQINATHIMEKFQLTRQAARTVLQQYRDHFPDHLNYDASNRAFLATKAFDDGFINSLSTHSFEQYLAIIAADINVQIDAHSTFIHEVEAPLRNINPLQVRPILRAIREKLAIDIGYISLTSPDYLDRIIQPHSLIFDGLRWHVRAYCNKNQSYRDFTLSRFNGVAHFEGKATNFEEQDELWNQIVDIVIEADPRFSDQEKRIIEQDFQIQDGQKTIPTRAALVNYALRRLRIDNYKNTPEEQQIVLTQACRKHITQYLP